METKDYTGVTRLATCRGMSARERHTFGPGAYTAPIQGSAQGTSVSAAISPLGKHVPATATNGAASGLRSWRHPV